MRNFSSRNPVIEPDKLARRLIQRAHNRDGLPEIAVGLSFLLISGFTCAQIAFPRGSVGFKAVAVSISVLIPVLCFGSAGVLRWVRRRYLIARVGYVQHNPIGRNQIVLGFLIAVGMTLALFGVVPRLAQPDRWLLAGTGLFGGALAAFAGRLPRFVIGGVLMAATGVLLAFSGVSLQVGLALLFGVQGLLALISGGVVFTRFMRQPIETGER